MVLGRCPLLDLVLWFVNAWLRRNIAKSSVNEASSFLSLQLSSCFSKPLLAQPELGHAINLGNYRYRSNGQLGHEGLVEMSTQYSRTVI